MWNEDLPGTIYVIQRHIFKALKTVSWFALYNLRLDRLEVDMQITLVCLGQGARLMNSCELVKTIIDLNPNCCIAILQFISIL